MESQTFTKDERLSSRKLIELVAKEGKSFLVHPFKVIAMETTLTTAFPAQVMMTAPKKRFSRAVDRNRIKRLMREAYRKNKHTLYAALNEQNKKLAIMLIYVGAGLPEYKTAEDKIILILQRLSKYEGPAQ
ncbi:MAG: ribonuclease P protein component [Bacteroidia bacterium]